MSLALPRRRFLLGLVAAPAVVRASSLMPVKLWRPATETFSVSVRYAANCPLVMWGEQTIYGKWLPLQPIEWRPS